MKINTALILCAGFGKRLNPITLTKPKPLLEINEVTMLEKSINLIKEMGIKKIFINTFYLKDHFSSFVKNKNFNLDIHIVEDGESILDTGGGILNMASKSDEDDLMVFNPDTIWLSQYRDEIIKMEEIYFSKKLENILLLVNKNLSFDQSLAGDFNLSNNLISKKDNLDFIYIGCQILNKKILANQTISKFSILNIWNKLIDEKKLYGFESNQKFYHLTDLNIFNKLRDL